MPTRRPKLRALMNAGGYRRSWVARPEQECRRRAAWAVLGISLLPLMTIGRKPVGRCHADPRSTREDTCTIRTDTRLPKFSALIDYVGWIGSFGSSCFSVRGRQVYSREPFQMHKHQLDRPLKMPLTCHDRKLETSLTCHDRKFVGWSDKGSEDWRVRVHVERSRRILGVDRPGVVGNS
jgi:hypothetical protein